MPLSQHKFNSNDRIILNLPIRKGQMSRVVLLFSQEVNHELALPVNKNKGTIAKEKTYNLPYPYPNSPEISLPENLATNHHGGGLSPPIKKLQINKFRNMNKHSHNTYDSLEDDSDILNSAARTDTDTSEYTTNLSNGNTSTASATEKLNRKRIRRKKHRSRQPSETTLPDKFPVLTEEPHVHANSKTKLNTYDETIPHSQTKTQLNLGDPIFEKQLTRTARPKFNTTSFPTFSVDLKKKLHLSPRFDIGFSPNTFQAQRLCLKMSEILPGELYLGSVDNLRDIQDFKKFGITDIISATIEKPKLSKEFEEDLGIEPENHHHFALRDRGDQNISLHFDEINRIITNSRGATFIHCHRGISRSVSFCISYLMATKRLTEETPSKPYGYVQAALNLIKEKRHIAEPNLGFFGQLTEYAKSIKFLDYQKGLADANLDVLSAKLDDMAISETCNSTSLADQDIMDIS